MTTPPVPLSRHQQDRLDVINYRRWAHALRTDIATALSTAENVLVDDERHGPLARTIANYKARQAEDLAAYLLTAAEQMETCEADARAHLEGRR